MTLTPVKSSPKKVAANLFILQVAGPDTFLRPCLGGAQSIAYRNVAWGLMERISIFRESRLSGVGRRGGASCRIRAVSEKLILRQQAGLDRREKRAFGTPSTSLDSTLVAGSLCPGQEERTMRKPLVKSGL